MLAKTDWYCMCTYSTWNWRVLKTSVFFRSAILTRSVFLSEPVYKSKQKTDLQTHKNICGGVISRRRKHLEMSKSIFWQIFSGRKWIQRLLSVFFQSFSVFYSNVLKLMPKLILILKWLKERWAFSTQDMFRQVRTQSYKIFLY